MYRLDRRDGAISPDERRELLDDLAVLLERVVALAAFGETLFGIAVEQVQQRLTGLGFVLLTLAHAGDQRAFGRSLQVATGAGMAGFQRRHGVQVGEELPVSRGAGLRSSPMPSMI
ncbi:hypothetical protein AB5I41_04665 [Sphingomonas sp. MMS24-JH45]